MVFHGAWPQVRLRRFAHACQRAGWDLDVICSRIAWERGLHDLKRIRVRCVTASPTPWSRLWLRALRGAIRQRRYCLVIVREALLAPIGVRVCAGDGVPVLLDIADDYPGCFAVWRRTEGLRGYVAGNWRKSPALMRWLERFALNNVQAVTCVCDESRRRLCGYGTTTAPMHVVPNVPMMDDFPAPLADAQRAPGSVVYPGELHPMRGVRQLMRACNAAGWRCLVIGDGKDADALSRNRESCADIVGPLPYRQMLDAANGCQVGAVPHTDCQITRTTVPNKLFEMMALGLPVVCSDLPPLRPLVQTTGAGLVACPGDPTAWTTALEALADPTLRMKCGAAGRMAVQSRYNWSLVEPGLCQLLENIAR